MRGQAGSVDLDVRGNVNYYGPLYIGSEYKETRMIYDTTSHWVVVEAQNTPNAMITAYDVDSSRTAQPQFIDRERGQYEDVSLGFGSVDFSGYKYTENMCLYQPRNDRSQ